MSKTSIIITTYNNPVWLEKVLWGFSCQTRQDFEIVIADDGSRDETRDLIDTMRGKIPMSIQHVWQHDDGFRKCRILNQAIMQAEGEYLIFTDGDCIPRRDFVETHLKHREPGAYLSGDYVRLPMSTSIAIGKEEILSGRCFDLDYLIANGYPPKKISQRLKAKGLKASFLDTFSFVQANWYGNNASGWKKDLVAVNGFDERMAYGGSDWEFGDRLNRSGIKRKRVRYRAIVLHLDHARAYANADLIEKNKAIWNEAVKNNTVWTDFGISSQSGT
ncbi:MAG TPA: glycosyltransferase family 2 protein [Arenimonas sp.]|nr:glycosyltransferase family 2 protein [Arenimonas sp.]HPW32019.1 glycosyltransferase family 2 protein [Arenimonas sp.]